MIDVSSRFLFSVNEPLMIQWPDVDDFTDWTIVCGYMDFSDPLMHLEWWGS